MSWSYGARSQRAEADIEAVIAQFRSVSVDAEILRKAGQQMRHFAASHGLDFADALIAATTEHHGLTLVTLNVRHFPMFKRLKPAY